MADPTWPPRLAVCAGAVVLDGDRVLWVRQAAGQPLAGQWSIPWGVVEPDETPEEAALREAREEGGVTAELAGLLGYQNLPSAGWVGLVFLARHVAGDPTADGRETDRAAYLSLADLDSLADPVEPWCAWIVRRVLAGRYTLVPPAADTRTSRGWRSCEPMAN